MIKDYYFKLVDKKPVPIDSYIEDLLISMNDDEMRRVAFDDIGPFSISTVFLFMNHNFTGNGKPVLFETMVFQNGSEVYEEDFELMDRYCTWDEATKGHKKICNDVRRLYWSATGNGVN